ncbi:hypothetical protein P8605_03230 [Streptomyces sp. T-3]|nr:hypothetical protein [Streptomyces sp. T-3]
MTAWGNSQQEQQGQPPRPEELRGAFQGQGRMQRIQATRSDRSRNARAARLVAVVVSVFATVGGIVLVSIRLNEGVGVGLWLVPVALGVALAPLVAVLGLRGRTRWAIAAFFLSYSLQQVGDILTVTLR